MALQKNVANRTRYLYLNALLCEKQNKLYNAIDIYNQIFSDRPQLPQYYEMALKLGCLYTETRQYQLADSVFNRNFSVLYKAHTMSAIFDQVAEAWCENLVYLNKTEQASKTLINLAHWMIYKTHVNSAGLSENEMLHYAQRIEGILNVLYTIISGDRNKKNQSLISDVIFIELQYRNLVLLNKRELYKEYSPKKYYYFDKTGSLRQAPGIKEMIAHEYSLLTVKEVLIRIALRN